MKKLYLIIFISILFILSCEDKKKNKKEINPIVGIWGLTSASGGVYLNVNKTQEIYLGNIQGEIQVTTTRDSSITDIHILTNYVITSNLDGIFINVSGQGDYSFVNYSIEDYVTSMDQYDQSLLDIIKDNGIYNYSGNIFNYSIGDHSLTINADTLIRKFNMDGNDIWDSTRSAAVTGTIEKIGSEIKATENYYFVEEILLPDNIIISLNEDGNGESEETFSGESNYYDFGWMTIDSLLILRSCEVIYNRIYCSKINYEYYVLTDTLILNKYQNLCDLLFEDDEAACDNFLYNEYGVELGTMEGFWLEYEFIFTRELTAEKVRKTMGKKTSPIGRYSIIKGLEIH